MRILPQFDPAKRPIVNPRRIVQPPQGSIPRKKLRQAIFGLYIVFGLVLAFSVHGDITSRRG